MERRLRQRDGHLAGLIQSVPAPGMVDLRAGTPDRALLPADMLARAADRMLARDPLAGLAYGAQGGPAPLREWLAARLALGGALGGRRTAIALTGGTSQALDQVVEMVTQTRDAILVEERTYHFALDIFRARGRAVRPMQCDGEGASAESLREAVRDARREGLSPGIVYLIPTFNNPSGHLAGACRRRELAEAIDSEGLFLVEDDPYRELFLDGEPPPAPVWTYLQSARGVWLGTFSKTLGPGMRLGWVVAEQSTLGRWTDAAVLVSGGGTNHLVAMIANELCCEQGLYDQIVATLRVEHRQRRDALLRGLGALARRCGPAIPRGGFFLWLPLPDDIPSVLAVRRAAAAGVACLDGALFAASRRPQSDRALRLSFGGNSPARLDVAGRALAGALEPTGFVDAPRGRAHAHAKH